MKLHVSSLQWQITGTGICISGADILIAVLLMIQPSLLKYYSWSVSKQFRHLEDNTIHHSVKSYLPSDTHNNPEDLKLY